MTATGVISGNGSSEQMAAVARVVRDRLPRFAPIPAVRRVKASGRACGTVIRLDTNVLLDFGSAGLRPDAVGFVDRIGKLLSVVKPRAVRVNGYTDHIGSSEANRSLSTRRAAAVLDALLAHGQPGGDAAPG